MMLTSERSEQVVALCQGLIQKQSYSGHEDGVVERMRAGVCGVEVRRRVDG